MTLDAIESLSRIEIRISEADKSCRNSGMTERCKQAVDNSIKRSECAAQAAEAILTITCEGQNFDGCQAQINGELLDINGGVLCEVNTSAAELRAQAELQ